MNLENDQIREGLQAARAQGEVNEGYLTTRLPDVEREGARQGKEALATYGMLEGSDLRIAPPLHLFAIWALTSDDLGVLSIHGTSTGAPSAMKPIPVTASPLKSHTRPRMPSKLSLRRASLVTQRAGGRRPVSYGQSTPVLSLETATTNFNAKFR